MLITQQECSGNSDAGRLLRGSYYVLKRVNAENGISIRDEA